MRIDCQSLPVVVSPPEELEKPKKMVLPVKGGGNDHEKEGRGFMDGM